MSLSSPVRIPVAFAPTRDGGEQTQIDAHANKHIERGMPRLVLQKAGLPEKTPLSYLAPMGRYTCKRSFWGFLLKFIRFDY